MMTQQSDAPPVSAPTQTSTSTRTNRPPHTHWLLLGIVIVMLGGFMWYFGVFRSRPDIAIVAGESAYWDLIIKGAQEAADRYDADLVVVRAQPDLESQNAKIREVTARKLSIRSRICRRCGSRLSCPRPTSPWSG